MRLKLLIQVTESLERDLELPIGRQRLALKLLPDQRTRPIVDFRERPIRVDLDDNGMLRLAAKRRRATLRRFDLHLLATGRKRIKALVGGRHQLQPIGIRHQALADTPHHMPIGSEVTTGKKGFQLVYGGVELLDQLLEFLVIHEELPGRHHRNKAQNAGAKCTMQDQTPALGPITFMPCL